MPLKISALWAIGAVAPFSVVPAVVYPVMEVAFMQGQDPLNDRKYDKFNNIELVPLENKEA
ncbi:hypothetical protein HMI54_010805 [Coelomomyces lativittatus]|nr:hypothetical protein HMI54_010805 [Coelomomyces lativittatus]